MSKEFINENNFEQNLTSETFQSTVNRHIHHLSESHQRVVERLQSYPPTYDDYRSLELTDRMTAALSIFYGEAPRKEHKSDTPQKPFTCDITPLTNLESGSVRATIIHSQGSYTNALNDTHVDKPVHLSISLTTTLDGTYLHDHLADLEILPHYTEHGYKNYTFTHNDFRIAERGWKKKYIEDPDDPLFQDVIKIVDFGIETLYQQRLATRIAKFGRAATQQSGTIERNPNV